MISVRPPAVGGRLGWNSTALGRVLITLLHLILCFFYSLTICPISSPPTSKRLKTSATTSAPPHMLAQQQIHPFHRVPTFEGIPIPTAPIPQQNPGASRKRPPSPTGSSAMMAAPGNPAGGIDDPGAIPTVESTPKKKGRTNTPWTAEEEQRLKTMRDAGRSWSEIAKVRARGFFFLIGSNYGLLTWAFFF